VSGLSLPQLIPKGQVCT